MTYDGGVLFNRDHGAELASRKLRSDQLILAELTSALAPHPGGLRRWSVMRAIRKDREATGHDIPHNFEVEVERLFRRFCADVDAASVAVAIGKTHCFFDPPKRPAKSGPSCPVSRLFLSS